VHRKNIAIEATPLRAVALAQFFERAEFGRQIRHSSIMPAQTQSGFPAELG
jgi:hypothetical protein